MVKLIQVAQHVDDLARAVACYRDLLDREPVATFDPPGLAFFDVDGVRLLLDAGAPSALHYLAVDDLAAVLARVERAGLVIETGPHVIFRHEDDRLGPAGTDEWMAFFRDTEGNLVGLVEQRPCV